MSVWNRWWVRILVALIAAYVFLGIASEMMRFLFFFLPRDAHVGMDDIVGGANLLVGIAQTLMIAGPIVILTEVYATVKRKQVRTNGYILFFAFFAALFIGGNSLLLRQIFDISVDLLIPGMGVLYVVSGVVGWLCIKPYLKHLAVKSNRIVTEKTF